MMADKSNNVNNTDVLLDMTSMPLDIMGLFFFAYRDFVSDADELLAEKNFGRAHHRVLYFVNIRPSMSVATLLSILKITKQSLARVLRQLIDSGYIEQKTGESDRRQRLLFATKKGQKFFQKLSKTQALRINAAMKDLPKEKQEIITQFFTDMINKKEHQMIDRLFFNKD
jgi:DNA-binding MarR family transcriptional regulator